MSGASSFQSNTLNPLSQGKEGRRKKKDSIQLTFTLCANPGPLHVTMTREAEEGRA